MTICATEEDRALDSPYRSALTIAADGSYGARLTRDDAGAESWFPERWTVGGPEPYAVPLPGSQPEEPDSELLPLADGRVLILRRVADHFALALLYPTGPRTGELPLGTVAAPELTLLPPAPGGVLGYALARGEHSTALWLVHGGACGPERVATVPGRCTGGAWLDRDGRLLALDRELDGRTKTVVVDLERGGEASPLLQITEESNDRLLLADPDSGLLIVRSDAPGHDRLGWGVLGSSLPVRFPECLRAGTLMNTADTADAVVTPFAVQPGQMLMPESCAVAFRIDAASGGTWLGVWRPSGRQLRQLSVPEGWLAGAGLWTTGGELMLPYATEAVPCGVARMAIPLGRAEAEDAGNAEDAGVGGGLHSGGSGRVRVEVRARVGDELRLGASDAPRSRTDDELRPEVSNELRPEVGNGLRPEVSGGIVPAFEDPDNRSTSSAHPKAAAKEPHRAPSNPQMCRPVPLQQAPLAAR
ncbi:hypothetical protein AB0I10_19470 [Streptomyces sp. NPDC050636]|uniref:hypothetical protein n=1 Tax=Streptomyces sp. NPDC050636 TaxID=3154510 RepID=UPI00342BBDC4